MATIAPAAHIVGAARQALPFGLFSTFTFRPDTSGRWENGGQFETISCDPAGGRSLDCDPEDVVGLPKDLDPNFDSGEADPFAVYGHFTCNPMNWTGDEIRDRAVAHLEAREESRVEQAFWTGDLGNTPSLAGATALNGGAAVKPNVGIGLLEAWIAKEYGSLGVIHMTRYLATVYDDLKEKGGILRTALGTPVAAGGGYPGTGPAGQVPGALQSWAYVSPALFGYRSEIIFPSSRPFDGLDRGTNVVAALAERTYLLGFDPCGVAAVLIDPTI